MKVLFVANSYYAKGNGLAGSARRTVRKLKAAGVDVRVLSQGNPEENGEQPDYILKDFHFPIFQKLIDKQGYSFSKTDKSLLRDAIKWADVIHLEEPFPLQIMAIKIAEEEHKPITGTYHLHPENIFASIGLVKSHFFNGMTMRIWRNAIFNHCKIVQCPTNNVKERLEKWKFKSELRVISNGLVMEELLTKNDEDSYKKIGNAKYNIITIGRYSNEKDLETLLNAMKYSKHNQEIQLIFAGKGPKRNALEKLALKYYKNGVLPHYPIFGFYSLAELQRLSIQADLYIHCAFVEVEGLSCMEAIQVGIVPIIAKGELTATSQFALSDKSIFKAKDPKDLASKIDYWLDNDKVRKEEAKKYIGLGNKYNIDNSIKELIKMFEDAIEMNNKENK